MALFRLLIIFVISIVLELYMFCEGHEMCANGLPLVKKASLKFCSLGNQDYGCCTEEYESTIKEKFDDLMAKIPENLAEACSSNLKEMLCHICHPLSGHSFESVVKLELPGMCPNYCQEFFQKCETLIQYLGKKSKKTYLLSKNSKDFCKKMETKDISYCYPDVKSNIDVMPGMSSNGNENNMATSHVSLGPECVCFKQMQGESILPMKIQELKDGSGRLLVAELAGILSIFHANGTKEKKPYFDIVDYINRKDYEDQHTSFGLPSFALHPNFNANGKLYVIYAKLIHGKLTHRVSEFIMTSDVQPEKTERILLELEPPYKWHNLDDLFFGDDGYLYIFNGDGGIQGDPDKLAQNGKSFFGKALRIDVDTRSGSKEYGIPPDNPFVNDDSMAPEVFAYGLRNPWRCSEDSGDIITGKGKSRIFCVDVGFNKYEEINIVKKGGNYGWNGKEGFSCFDSKICNKMEHEEFPIFAYNHMKGKSVIGGEVYRGNCIPHLQGKYLFADYYFK
ncbi:hypothetical protein FSP39_020513 [Pinctada imbricata]|uniref:Glucose/Sorbosone dehydrogenase domain-containing protein n=1 Tax=Pinctada imbricata TaxID=66713 RepID=A0AA88XGC1_PINIB|nr:hypothetical protein FSP39_020513 [Pinctada imbricata]